MARPRTKPGRLSDLARHVVLPDGIVSTGWPAVRDQCRELFGDEFDEWQDGAGRAILAKRADDVYAATVGGIVLSIPRQVAKTFLVGRVLVALCLLFPNLTVLWTAHRTRTATRTFQSMQRLMKRKKVAPYVSHIRTANGEQEIGFRNGSAILFGAREQGFGRGFDEVDVEVFDEAQILTERALEDMVAATNQARHPHGALLFYMGTPPRPADPGEAFSLKRQKALSGKAKDMVYIEFGADRDADLDDRKQWAKANPSYPHRTPLESMLRLRENLPSDEAWRREALGIWDEQITTRAIIPTALWDILETDEPPAQDVPPSALAVDMSPDRVVSVAGAWATEDRAHIELLAIDAVDDPLAAVDFVAERAGHRIRVLIDQYSPAAAMVPALKARKVKVVLTSGSDMGKACGLFYDDVVNGRLTHAAQEQLDSALAHAKKRKIGTSGAWGWDRADIDTNLAPLVSATLARYGAASHRRRGERSGSSYQRRD